MAIARSEYEKLGAFYLGKEYDLKAGEVQDDLVLYDSKDLVTRSTCRRYSQHVGERYR